MKKTTIHCLSLFAIFSSAHAQNVEQKDSIAKTHTLPDVLVSHTEREKLTISKLETDVKGIRSVVSPLGEGDPIKWVQNLPGVTTGADGTTAFYVRGSNMGNNLFSIDGVPVYGYSHLLGMTTIIPQSAMQDVTLTKGGFDGRENNFTAAHLNVASKTPDEKMNHGVSLNTFLLSAESEGNICKNLSYLVSARISPLTCEYRAIRSALPDLLGDLEGFNANVGDIYGKLHWNTSHNSWLEASGMGSLDEYAFSREVDSDESMGWKNGIGMLRWHWNGKRTVANVSASYNYYSSQQKQDKIFRGKENHLSLMSKLKETTVEAEGTTDRTERLKVGYGAKVRFASFEPGQVASVRNKSDIMLGDAFLQGEYSIPEKLDIKAFVRLNYYKNRQDENQSIDPEAGISARFRFNQHLTMESTFDRLVQYYHTLEGLPVGWSLDMIVPTVEKISPETSLQGGLNLAFNYGHHLASIGGYYKKLNNLVYYKHAEDLFNGGMAAWQDKVAQGQGTSYGCEFLYIYEHKDLYARVSYTWSKTDRSGFEEVNDGKPFHARFDRRHVLNVLGQWRIFSASLAMQSGHWETGAPEIYEMHVMGGEAWESQYFHGVNNYQMPMVLRLDLGYQRTFKTGDIEHELNLGLCNATNHFNPFMLYFDSKKEKWTALALLPILPTFSYKVSF